MGTQVASELDTYNACRSFLAACCNVDWAVSELQRLHEVLLDKPLQKKSFRRRIEKAELVEEAGQRAPNGKGRPSVVYRLKADARDHTFTRNLEY